MSDYDVIVIGSGAGGGTLVNRLAPSGKRILLLERGDWLRREPQNWSAADVFVDGRYISEETWYDGETAKAFQPQVHYFVGGATKLYGAALYRLREEDFGELRHHDGISPAWPIGYDELEPYYTEAERLYRVHGARGEDPTEPDASAPYPFPAVSHEPRIQQLADDLAAAGHQPFHAPCGVMLNEDDMAYSDCVRCSTCDGFPCLVHAKSDAEVLAVRPALEHPNVTLLRNARGGGAAHEPLRHGRDRGGGRSRGPAGDLRGRHRRRLVRGGQLGQAAAGLGHRASTRTGWRTAPTRSGATTCSTTARPCWPSRKEENPTVFQKTLGLNDFYFGSDDFDFPLGNIQMVGKSSAPMYRGEKPLETKLAPTRTLENMARHAVDFWLSTEDLPRPENRVTLDRDGHVRLSYRPSNEEPKKRLYHKLKSLLGALRDAPRPPDPAARLPQERDPGCRLAHQAGTCRFGTDPATSVLNTDCRAHELDNLYVVDTSFFPSIGAVNPALTAMANALRVGDHLLERLAGRAA